jgi:hypothetical protein
MHRRMTRRRGMESSQGGENDDAPSDEDMKRGDGEARPPPSHHLRHRLRVQPGDAESAESFILNGSAASFVFISAQSQVPSCSIITAYQSLNKKKRLWHVIPWHQYTH